MRGDTRLGYDLATRLYQTVAQPARDDDPATLRAATSIATALTQMGRHADACKLDKYILDRRRRVLGADHADHPQALHSASNLDTDMRMLREVDADS